MNRNVLRTEIECYVLISNDIFAPKFMINVTTLILKL